jgi:uncharacterized membrane protein YbhN (UPF0104 family)
VPTISRLLWAEGMTLSVAGWILLGLSQVAVIDGLMPERLGASYWPMVIGSVALATVAGFAVAVLPGGLGVREGVLMTTLVPAIGQEVAVVAALVLRLVWVAGELLAAALLGLYRPPLTRTIDP